jgi:hypothetical protein
MLFIIGFIIGCLFLIMFFKTNTTEEHTGTTALIEALVSGIKTAIFIASFVGLAFLASAPSFLGIVFLTKAIIATIFSYMVIGFIIGLLIPSLKRLFNKNVLMRPL